MYFLGSRWAFHDFHFPDPSEHTSKIQNSSSNPNIASKTHFATPPFGLPTHTRPLYCVPPLSTTALPELHPWTTSNVIWYSFDACNPRAWWARSPVGVQELVWKQHWLQEKNVERPENSRPEIPTSHKHAILQK